MSLFRFFSKKRRRESQIPDDTPSEEDQGSGEDGSPSPIIIPDDSQLQLPRMSEVSQKQASNKPNDDVDLSELPGPSAAKRPRATHRSSGFNVEWLKKYKWLEYQEDVGKSITFQLHLHWRGTGG